MMKIARLALICLVVLCVTPAPGTSAPVLPKGKGFTEQQVTLQNFLDKVYQTMDDHYYLPVRRDLYDNFLQKYTAEYLITLNNRTKQTENFVHLGAGLLVNQLKGPKDKVTLFIPPKKAKEFKEKAYAVTEDLGIEGQKNPRGFLITKVQKHTDSYREGLRSGDIILQINQRVLDKLSQEEIQKLLTPEVGNFTTLRVWYARSGIVRNLQLESKSYFRETIVVVPSPLKNALVLQIQHFNQLTAPDFADALKEYGIDNIKNLVIDLRNNEGGPPLAAREILGIVLPANDPLFAIVRKKQRPVMMAAPQTPVSYHGPIHILVNKKTGSAAEMFSGVLQTKGAARLLGQRTAGVTYLKSIYDFDDKSMIFMITSLTYFHNRTVFPDDGLTPDIVLDENQDALEILTQDLARGK